MVMTQVPASRMRHTPTTPRNATSHHITPHQRHTYTTLSSVLWTAGVVSGAMIKIVPAFGLDTFQHEMVVSSTIALAAVGAALSGPANKMLGRKGVLRIACTIFTMGAVLMSAAGSYFTLLFGRMTVGAGVGIASSTVPMYIAELAPPARRGLFIATNNAMVVVGQVIASLVDGAFSGVPDGWRWMLGLGGVPSVIQFVGEQL